MFTRFLFVFLFALSVGAQEMEPSETISRRELNAQIENFLQANCPKGCPSFLFKWAKKPTTATEAVPALGFSAEAETGKTFNVDAEPSLAKKDIGSISIEVLAQGSLAASERTSLAKSLSLFVQNRTGAPTSVKVNLLPPPVVVPEAPGLGEKSWLQLAKENFKDLLWVAFAIFATGGLFFLGMLALFVGRAAFEKGVARFSQALERMNDLKTDISPRPIEYDLALQDSLRQIESESKEILPLLVRKLVYGPASELQLGLSLIGNGRVDLSLLPSSERFQILKIQPQGTLGKITQKEMEWFNTQVVQARWLLSVDPKLISMRLQQLSSADLGRLGHMPLSDMQLKTILQYLDDERRADFLSQLSTEARIRLGSILTTVVSRPLDDATTERAARDTDEVLAAFFDKKRQNRDLSSVLSFMSAEEGRQMIHHNPHFSPSHLNFIEENTKQASAASLLRGLSREILSQLLFKLTTVEIQQLRQLIESDQMNEVNQALAPELRLRLQGLSAVAPSENEQRKLRVRVQNILRDLQEASEVGSEPWIL